LSQLGGVGVKLFGGNRVVVRYVYRGTVYGFETTIMDSISSPFRLLFLTYPRVVSERNIRSNRRVNTLLPARLGPETDAAEGTVTDISIAGCQLEIPNDRLTESVNISIDAECILMLQLPGVAGDFQIRGKLKNVNKDAKLTRLGIAFEELDENVQLAIDAYVKQSV